MRHILIPALLLAASCSASTEEPAPIITIDIEDEVVDEVPDEVVEEPELGPLPEFVGTPVLQDLNPRPDIVEVKIAADARKVQFDDLELDMLTYNGSFPGPLLEANVGDTVIVHFTNHTRKPTTIHWHGLRIPDDMDGNPRIQDPVAPGKSFTYRFVVPDEGTFWYHPHVRTNEQIEAGLYGPLVVHERPEDRPRHDRERFFVLDDMLIDGDRIAAPFRGGQMELMHGRLGNVLVTNGQFDMVTGEAMVGERERWRFVNTSNARTMEVTIDGARFVVHGNDGGAVEPYETDTLLLPVGQRFDVEVIYDKVGAVKLQQLVLVRNSAGRVVTEPFDVATIDVSDAPEGAEPTEVVWPAPRVWETRTIDREETIVLDAVQGGELGVEWRINGQANRMAPLFEFERGETVKLTIRNMLGPEHPFHLHGQFFQVAGKPGVWDTILVGGQETVEITAFMDNPGSWMMHCHIAEHAELGMMSSFLVNE